jgi:hypothetical protein
MSAASAGNKYCINKIVFSADSNETKIEERELITVLSRRVRLVAEELLSLPEHLSSSPVFNGVRVPRSLFLY